MYGYKFDKLRRETMDWFKTQELILMPFNSGGNQYGYGSMLVCPKQCAFFAFALAHLQGFVSAEETEGYKPRALIYVAPPFRHTHFDGKQVVVHCIRARLPRRVFTPYCSTLASRRAGPLAILLQAV